MKLAAGEVVRVPHFSKNDEPKTIKINSIVAKRCEWLREQCHDDKVCDVFRDRKTGEVYIDVENGKQWKHVIHVEPKKERKKKDEKPKRVHVDENAPTCFTANAGPTLRYYPKAKKVVLVPLRARVAERLVYKGLQRLAYKDGNGTVEYSCAMFEDPKNHVIYGQVADEEVDS